MRYVTPYRADHWGGFDGGHSLRELRPIVPGFSTPGIHDHSLTPEREGRVWR